MAEPRPPPAFRLPPMAQINPPKSLTTSRPDDLRQDNLTTAASRGTEFFEDHRNTVIGVIVGIVVLALAVIGWRYVQSERSAEGQVLLGAILTEYEAGNYRVALDGTDLAPGLLEIADEYGSTPTGRQATFFAADALYQLGEYDQALAFFEDYSGDGLLAASALAGQAAILELRGEFERAADLYADAADEYASPASTPGYLLDAARAHRRAGDADAAQGVLTQLTDDWADVPEYRTALVELGEVEAEASAVGEPTGDIAPAPVTPAEAPATDDPVVVPTAQ